MIIEDTIAGDTKDFAPRRADSSRAQADISPSRYSIRTSGIRSMTQQRVGHWTQEEHRRYLAAIEMYPHGPWESVAGFIGTRSARQTQTHDQKYRQKLSRRRRGLLRNRAMSDESAEAQAQGSSRVSSKPGDRNARTAPVFRNLHASSLPSLTAETTKAHVYPYQHDKSYLQAYSSRANPLPQQHFDAQQQVLSHAMSMPPLPSLGTRAVGLEEQAYMPMKEARYNTEPNSYLEYQEQQHQRYCGGNPRVSCLEPMMNHYSYSRYSPINYHGETYTSYNEFNKDYDATHEQTYQHPLNAITAPQAIPQPLVELLDYFVEKVCDQTP